MITSWDVYWITRLDSLNVFFAIVIITYLLIGIIGGIATCIEEKWDDGNWPTIKKMWAYGTISFCIITFMAVFIPSTKEAVAIYLIPKIANNEQIQKLPDNALRFMNKKLEEWLTDMEGGKRKK